MAINSQHPAQLGGIVPSFGTMSKGTPRPPFRPPRYRQPSAARVYRAGRTEKRKISSSVRESSGQSGKADLIALAREMLANPNFAAQAALALEGPAGWDLWSDQFRY